MAKTVGVLRGSICFIAGKFHQTKLLIVLSACVRACAFVRVLCVPRCSSKHFIRVLWYSTGTSCLLLIHFRDRRMSCTRERRLTLAFDIM